MYLCCVVPRRPRFQDEDRLVGLSTTIIIIVVVPSWGRPDVMLA